jgi:hypothetical protein
MSSQTETQTMLSTISSSDINNIITIRFNGLSDYIEAERLNSMIKDMKEQFAEEVNNLKIKNKELKKESKKTDMKKVKEEEKQLAKEAKNAAKEAKKAEKEAAKEAKKAEKEAAKEAKKAEKEAAKEAKKTKKNKLNHVVEDSVVEEVVEENELVISKDLDAVSEISTCSLNDKVSKSLKKENKEFEREAKKAAKEAEKEAKKAEKDAEKEAKKAEKDAEKAAKKAEKDAEKAAKKAEKEAEKEAKKAEKEAEKQKESRNDEYEINLEEGMKLKIEVTNEDEINKSVKESVDLFHKENKRAPSIQEMERICETVYKINN